MEFAERLLTIYGKTPVFYGNSYMVGKVLDARFDRYMLWLARYGNTATALKLPGTNPWTLWQYSGDLTVQGIGSKVDGNVFFGTLAQYQEFKAGRGNIALIAALASGESRGSPRP